jgi:hypothetical protein
MTVAAPTMVSVFDGRELAGFILTRGKSGFEALDCNEKSLGLFASQKEAAIAVMEKKDARSVICEATQPGHRT